MRRAVVVLSLLAACVIPAAAALKDAKKTLTVGNWAVLQDKDLMTDKIDCTGIWKGNFQVQLSEVGFYFGVPGGIQSVTLRFDDEPAESLRLATKIEKDIRSVILEGSDLKRVLEAKRLRYQVSTLVRGLQQGEMDLTGIKEAYEHIKAGCPAAPKPKGEISS